jgi:3-oxoacyl-[acyl-carrier protein] reductase
MLSASFILTVIGTKLPRNKAIWFSQSLEFILLVRVSDTIKVVAKVIKKYKSERILELKTEIINQDGRIVIKGIAKVKLASQEENDEKPDRLNKDKTGLIIGGTGGIGSATARQLFLKGYKIILHYNKNKSLAKDLKAELEKMEMMLI